MSASRSPATSVDVYLSERGDDILLGQAFFSTARGQVTTTFRYADDYLTRKGAWPIEPGLPLFAGPQAVAGGLPHSFTDCTPDRWGRDLIKKRRQAEDVRAGRVRTDVTEVDILLEVTDETRQGALRFTARDSGPEGPFLSADRDVPMLIELPRLMAAADKAEATGDLEAVKELLNAGTGSLGGARPKASVRDGDRLFIAKFTGPQDGWDVIGWEKTALDLAVKAGITVPDRRLVPVGARPVLLLERFDRTPAGGRVPYVSAMTLLGARDGGNTAFDYIDLADVLTENGAVTVKADLVEMWRRLAFSAAINNTDDHLRNHGFLRGSAGWVPSPLFDVNPNPDTGAARQLAIGAEYYRSGIRASLGEVAEHYGVRRSQASAILREIFAATSEWRQCAASNGVPKREFSLMEDAFDGMRDLADHL